MIGIEVHMEYKINVGDAIPEFKSIDQEGFEITTEDLFGSPVVLYFYPQDETSTCTKEACGFRDNMQRLAQEDVVIIGVSPDSPASHQKFINKNNLNFTLLSDEKAELCRKFDVIRETDANGQKKLSLERTTFLIDRDGIVQWLERPVHIEGHIDRVSEAVKQYIR